MCAVSELHFIWQRSDRDLTEVGALAASIHPLVSFSKLVEYGKAGKYGQRALQSSISQSDVGHVPQQAAFYAGP